MHSSWWNVRNSKMEWIKKLMEEKHSFASIKKETSNSFMTMSDKSISMVIWAWVAF